MNCAFEVKENKTMKNKRRIRAIYNKLRLSDRTAEVKAAQDILAWVLEEDGAPEFFEEIIEGIQEPRSRLSSNVYAYDEVQEVWTMIDPTNPNQAYITQTKPDFTPDSWWVKKPLDDIKEEIVFGMNYLGEIIPNDYGYVSWELVEELFSTYRTSFRTRAQVVKFLEHYYPIDYTGRLDVGEEERKILAERDNLSTTSLRAGVEDYFKADWVYTYKEKGERIWAMKLREE